MKKVWALKRDELDFEHNVKNKRADIGIIINNQLASIIEVKKRNENLNNHIEQAIEYGVEKQIEFVALTNGKRIQVICSFCKRSLISSRSTN